MIEIIIKNKKSRLTNLLEFFDCVKVVDREAVNIIYLHLQKAFDKVLYESLLKK